MKMKRSTITVLAVVLVFAVAIGAVAAVYIMQQAKVNIFAGRLGYVDGGQVVDNDQLNDEEQPELIVKVDGVEVGHEATLSYQDDIIPVLSDVNSRYVDWNNYIWESKSGVSAFVADDFVLTAKGGDLNNLAYDINVVGNPSIVSALRFGFVVEFNDDECGRVARIFQSSLHGVALPEILGDGNIAEDEEIRVSVAVWADAYALADLGRFDDMSFSIDVIFSAGNDT